MSVSLNKRFYGYIVLNSDKNQASSDRGKHCCNYVLEVGDGGVGTLMCACIDFKMFKYILIINCWHIPVSKV